MVRHPAQGLEELLELWPLDRVVTMAVPAAQDADHPAARQAGAHQLCGLDRLLQHRVAQVRQAGFEAAALDFH